MAYLPDSFLVEYALRVRLSSQMLSSDDPLLKDAGRLSVAHLAGEIESYLPCPLNLPVIGGPVRAVNDAVFGPG